ncbi:MAG: tetratricopeptide repeat protein [Bacteroidia bacterium]
MTKRLFYIPLVLISLLYSSAVYAQQNKNSPSYLVDSLRTILKKLKDDTARINLMNYISDLLVKTSKYHEADSFARAAINESGRINYTKGSADALFNFGHVATKRGDYKESIEFYTKATKVYGEMGDSVNFSKALRFKGSTYWREGNYPMALEMEFRAMHILERHKDNSGALDIYNNIGNIYGDMSDFDNALLYYNKGLKVAEENHDKYDIALLVGNMGDTYQEEGKFSKAIEYSTRAMKLYKEIGNMDGMIDAIDNLGDVCFQEEEYTASLEYYMKGLSISEEIGNKQSIVDNLVDIAKTYEKQKKYGAALDYANRGADTARQIGARADMRDGEQVLALIYENIHNVPLAYLHYKTYIAIHDSLADEENARKITRSEMMLEYEKNQAMAKAEQDKKDLIARAESKKQKMIIVFVVILAIAIAVIAIVILRSLRITRKQKLIIEEQKELVDEKQKDIIDSINYAQRIQAALLKEEERVSMHLPDHFILFKPKDIVSGDFHWMIEKGEYFYVAAVDCTGHGVPGGFMSMLGVAFLNEITAGSEILTPSEILDRLRDKIIKELGQAAGTDNEDGMDMSLIRINLKTNEIQWSGANNPLYIVRDKGNGISGRSLEEISPDKQPVGNYPMMKPFTNHIIKPENDTLLYFFSDGYADQFGGPEGKKFKYSRLKEVLLEIYQKPMEEQKQILKETFDKWKGGLDQIDDVLIIGVKI